MLTGQYARKPLYVEAVQLTRENLEEVAEWCEGNIVRDSVPDGDTRLPDDIIEVKVLRPINDRQTKAHYGDWVLKSGRGDFKVFTDRAFKNSFDRVATMPVRVNPSAAADATIAV